MLIFVLENMGQQTQLEDFPFVFERPEPQLIPRLRYNVNALLQIEYKTAKKLLQAALYHESYF